MKNLNNKLKSIFSLENKVIVITGATGLLGRQHVEAIAAYGGTPVILDLSGKEVKVLAEDINERFDANAMGLQVDITKESDVKSICEEIVRNFKAIDGLINNAANNPKFEEDHQKNFSRLEHFKIDNWNKDLSVGLTGAFLCAKYFGTSISKNPNGGSIINISSDLGLIGPDQRLYSDRYKPDYYQPVKPVSYSVVKAGIIGLTRYLATYWPEKNVRCNAICPGGVENGQNISFIKKVSSRVPLNRMAKLDEYQGAIIWALSDAASYLNGAVIPIDGGRTSW